MTPSTAILMMAEACEALATAGKSFSPADLAQHAKHLGTMARLVGKREVESARMQARLDEIVATYNAPVEGPNVVVLADYMAREWTHRGVGS